MLEETYCAAIAAASPARVATNSSALPTQTGTRRFTPSRNAAVSIRPIWSAYRSTRIRSGFTSATIRQKPEGLADRCPRPEPRPRCDRDRRRDPPVQLRPLQPFRLFPTVESPTDALFPLLALPPREVHHVQDYCARPGPRRGRRPGSRHARRPLPHRGARGRRRDGRGLPRARRRARARGGDQGPPPIARRRPGVRRSVPARGTRRGVPLPPEHRRGLRLGRGRRHLLHGHGVRPRARRARAAERERPARAGTGRRDRAADAPRARGRARARHRPPRHQAGEHPRHRRRAP